MGEETSFHVLRTLVFQFDFLFIIGLCTVRGPTYLLGLTPNLSAFPFFNKNIVGDVCFHEFNWTLSQR